MAKTDDPRRNLPGVDAVLDNERLRRYVGLIRQEIIVGLIREEIAAAREAISKGKEAASTDRIAARVAGSLDRLTSPSLRKAINATGVVLHTGLGRAPLSKHAQEAVSGAAEYCNLEFDLPKGERGDRQDHLRELLVRLTGAEDALVVNNNAAAVYLTLNTLAYHKEAVVSRGQLIEIGGSFRLPDIMKRAGVKLVEVGTTNRTRVGDYREAVTPKTALLLRAYPSNYRIDGFTESVSIAELSDLGKELTLPVVDDLGGGLLWDWTEFGLPYEPNVRESLQQGADLVLVSGDKVMGGPQAGIIVGRRDLVRKLTKSPLARVLRADKLTVAALSSTLRNFLYTTTFREFIPSWQMLTAAVDALRPLAEKLHAALLPLCQWKVLEILPSSAEAGSGTLPAVAIPSLAVRCLPEGWTCSTWAKALRMAETPVLGTVRDDLLHFDLRTLRPGDLDMLIAVVEKTLKKGSS